MSQVKRLCVDIRHDPRDGYTNISCDAIKIIEVYGEAVCDFEAIVDLALQNLRAEILRQMEKLKDEQD